MTTLSDLADQPPPTAWDGSGLPWHDPGFSERMLSEHLSQEHDAASRRLPTIDRHAAWIHHVVLGGRPSRVLDLGCGPGLLTARLARLGHTCRGIDMAPSAITHAAASADRERLVCEYVLGDIRSTDLGGPFDLVTFGFGDLDTVPPDDVEDLLDRCAAALAPGGRLLLEVHTPRAVEAKAAQGLRWSRHERGLFSDRPHLLLLETAWDQAAGASVERYTVIDAAEGRITQHVVSVRCLDDDAYDDLLRRTGFSVVHRFGDLTGRARRADDEFVVIVAEPGGRFASGARDRRA